MCFEIVFCCLSISKLAARSLMVVPTITRLVGNKSVDWMWMLVSY